MEFWFSGVQETPAGSASGAGFVSTANNEQYWGGVPVSRTVGTLVPLISMGSWQ
ncbi:hypothetical protein Hanom_Chr07g00593791 [Helianthus anomalus]